MSNTSLAPGLKQRHVTMLSIAGVIGADLFVFSGHAIAKAGPAALRPCWPTSSLARWSCW